MLEYIKPQGGSVELNNSDGFQDSPSEGARYQLKALETVYFFVKWKIMPKTPGLSVFVRTPATEIFEDAPFRGYVAWKCCC